MNYIDNLPDDIIIKIIEESINNIFESIEHRVNFLKQYDYRIGKLSKSELRRFMIINDKANRSKDLNDLTDSDYRDLEELLVLNHNQKLYDKILPVIVKDFRKLQKQFDLLTRKFYQITKDNKTRNDYEKKFYSLFPNKV